MFQHHYQDNDHKATDDEHSYTMSEIINTNTMEPVMVVVLGGLSGGIKLGSAGGGPDPMSTSIIGRFKI